MVRRTAEACFMPLTVGGGVRTVEDIRALLLAGRRQGVDQHGRGEPTRLRREAAEKFGDQCIVVAIDAKSVGGERTLGDLHPWRAQRHRHRRRRLRPRGGRARRGRILLTSMDRDGTKAGYDLDADPRHRGSVPVPVIASGGVGTLDHLVDGVRDGHASAVLAASIFHFGTHSIGEAKAHMAAGGLAMRLDGPATRTAMRPATPSQHRSG